MIDPLQALEEKIDAKIARAEVALEIRLVREEACRVVSRLLTLDQDPKHQANDQVALAALANH